MGTPRWLTEVHATPQLDYNVHFQNKPTASAAVVYVQVTEPVPTSVDPTSVALSGFGFGTGTRYVAPADQQSILAEEPSGDLEGDQVQVTGHFNRATSMITWTFSTINPATGDLDYNATAGFLPPDNATGIGEGYVSYTAQAKPGLSTGTKVQAQASIIFDRNTPISTTAWSNSIDNTTPTASVTTLPARSRPGNLTVHWSGNDGTGSGVTSYNVYVSVDGGPLTKWQSDTSSNSASYPLSAGHTYGFAAQATSLVGLSGPVPTSPQANTSVATGPTITKLTPSTGSGAGGTTVTITGTHLTGTTKVLFGATTAASFSVVNATSITAKTGPHGLGKVSVSVQTTHGTATKTTAFTFVLPAPTVLTLTPTSGTTTGGTTVTITGTHLTGTTKVEFGTSTASTLHATGSTKLVVKSPVHPAGKVAVTVFTSHGTGTKPSAFTFVTPPPTISSVTPGSGPTTGGTTVTITGTHLTATTKVTFGGTAAGGFVVKSSTAISATTQAHPAGTVSVEVATSHGTATRLTAFTFVAPPPPPPPAKTAGYDMVGSDGGVFVFAPPGTSGGFFGSLPGLTPPVHVNNIVGMVPTATDQGYFLVGNDGGVFAFGNAPFLGSLPGIGKVPAQPITGIVAANTDRGYYLVGADGGVFAFGTVPFLGSLPGENISVDNIIGIAATPSGSGYWLISATGTVYAFGVAKLGTVKGTASPVSAIAGTPTGNGYWVTTQNGEVFPFGTAHSFGTLTTISVSPVHPVIGIVHTADTGGYWLLGSDGGIFAFGDAGFVGSLPGVGVNVTNVVGAVPTES